MTSLSHVVTLSPRDYDAVLFDLDGVLTKTASVHAAAWKRMFDEFLQKRAARTGVSLVPFDIQEDYLRYVDGKPRYDGVVAFLQSRGIDVPFWRFRRSPRHADGTDARQHEGHLLHATLPWTKPAAVRPTAIAVKPETVSQKCQLANLSLQSLRPVTRGQT